MAHPAQPLSQKVGTGRLRWPEFSHLLVKSPYFIKKDRGKQLSTVNSGKFKAGHTPGLGSN